MNQKINKLIIVTFNICIVVVVELLILITAGKKSIDDYDFFKNYSFCDGTVISYQLIHNGGRFGGKDQIEFDVEYQINSKLYVSKAISGKVNDIIFYKEFPPIKLIYSNKNHQLIAYESDIKSPYNGIIFLGFIQILFFILIVIGINSKKILKRYF